MTDGLDGSHVAQLAAHLRHASPGVLARLRRFHPRQDPRAAAFETEWLLESARVPATAQTRDRWAVLVHCLAIVRGRHASGPDHEPGQVLARLRVSEARVRQLVEADEAVLMDLLPRLARRLAAAGVSANWSPLADLLLLTGTALDERADAARRRIVREYLRAEGRIAGVAQEASA